MKPLKLTVYINDLKLSLLRCFAIGNAKLTKYTSTIRSYFLLISGVVHQLSKEQISSRRDPLPTFSQLTIATKSSPGVPSERLRNSRLSIHNSCLLSPFKRCRSINVLFGRSKNLFSTNFLPIVSLRNQLPTSSLRIDQDKWAFFGTTFCYYYYDVDLFEPWYPSPSMNCCYIVLNSTKQ
ncbi:hypothetical protein M514_15129 [Trichuris suis]|uniref:Uncharacterized protein n=1 Tax=Trichuris suis TaxID=68888 RepID=A0A085NTC9_9BILA|nr:hypothetical protein M514_15129 [Trichuris suis]